MPARSASCFSQSLCFHRATRGRVSLTVIRPVKERDLSLGSLKPSIMLGGQQGCSPCPPAVTADTKWLIKRSSDRLHRANSAITTENVNIDSFGSLCAGWSYSPPCVAIKQSDLEPKSLGSLSASLCFSFCFFFVSVAQSGPPEKHMPIQQRGETKFLFLRLSWPEQTPHKVGKSAPRPCQAKILVHPPLPPATPKIPQSCQIHSAAQFWLDFFIFLLMYESLYVKSQKNSSRLFYLQDVCSCPRLFLGP